MAQWQCRVFFACSGCSVMFLNDSTFNSLHAVATDVGLPAVVTPMRRRGGQE